APFVPNIESIVPEFRLDGHAHAQPSIAVVCWDVRQCGANVFACVERTAAMISHGGLRSLRGKLIDERSDIRPAPRSCPWAKFYRRRIATVLDAGPPSRA